MTSDTDAIWVNRAKKAILLIRILVGWVFLSEGIQKFLFPEALGVGRFTKIGIPLPQLMAHLSASPKSSAGRSSWLVCSPALPACRCSSTFVLHCATAIRAGFASSVYDLRDRRPCKSLRQCIPTYKSRCSENQHLHSEHPVKLRTA
jgi:DoxX